MNTSRQTWSLLLLLPLLGLFSAILAQRPPHGQDLPQASAARKRLTLVALGAWQGDFLHDAEGRSGMAAVHAYLRQLDNDLEREGGALVVVQSGAFTGAESAEDFYDRLVYPEFALSHQLMLDAMAASGAEALLYEGNAHPELKELPLLSLNRKPPVPRLRERRLLSRAQMQLWLGAAQSGPRGSFGPLRGIEVADEIRRHNGADLFVMLIEDRPAPLPDNAAAWVRAGEALETEAFWEAIFPQWLDDFDPYRAAPHNHAQRMVFVQAPAERNLFRRLPEGPFLCRIAGRSLCRIDFELRNSQILGVRQQFVDLNGARSAAAWVAPDRRTLAALRRAATRLNQTTGPRRVDPVRGPDAAPRETKPDQRIGL